MAEEGTALSAQQIFNFVFVRKPAVQIEMCQLLVKSWEERLDQGHLTESSFTQMLLSQDDETLAKGLLQRKDRASPCPEALNAVAALLWEEMSFQTTSNQLKLKLSQCHGFNASQLFSQVASARNCLDWKDIYRLLIDQAAETGGPDTEPSQKRLEALMRRLSMAIELPGMPVGRFVQVIRPVDTQ
jgi:hypothetical protein